LAVALFLLAGFHPTFGGMIARPGFATGGMSFLQGQSAGLALMFGAGASAFMYGLFLGLAVILACLRLSLRWRSFGAAIVSLVALWLGAVILLQGQHWALDPPGAWPVRPLDDRAALTLALSIGLAFLPYTLVLRWRLRQPASDARPTRKAKAVP
jgi:hypothetical protein